MSVAENIIPDKPSNIVLSHEKPFVLIGTGPVGFRFLHHILQKHKLFHPIIIYGSEPWHPYNRIQLSSLLAGTLDKDEIYYSTEYLQNFPVITRYNTKVIDVDKDKKIIIDEFGHKQPYEKLILATGSSPYIPSIKGVDLNGVFSFRDLGDVEKLIARRARSHHTVIVGGGLLGVETARAMQKHSTEVTIIEHNSRLLFKQLDEKSGLIFNKRINEFGINTLLNEQILEITGKERVKQIKLRSGKIIDCDTVVISTGIKPNLELAKKAGLAYGRGIKVDDHMQTSNPSIYAIGECCEHRGEVYGIAAPGFEQAQIAANALLSISEKYKGSMLATSIKIAGESVFSMGDVNDHPFPYSSYVYEKDNIYRKIDVYRGQIQSVLALGDWTELSKIREHVKKGKHIFLWNLLRFNESGMLWDDTDVENVNLWPRNSIVCSCNSISRGQLTDSISLGHNSLKQLGEVTGAGTNCGSCKTLLANMLGGINIDPIKGYKFLSMLSPLIILISLITFLLPSIPYTNTVQLGWRWDEIWTNTFYKQISGFTLLGLSVLVLILSLRKRLDWFRWGEFSNWRIVHIILGSLTIFVLLAHTGFRFGSNLNFLLMSSFASLILIGSVLSMISATEHKFNSSVAREIKSYSFWLHLIFFWPIPVLLGFHILKTYYF